MSRISDLVERIQDEQLKNEIEIEVIHLLSKKKFGLVWENKTEDIVENCKKKNTSNQRERRISCY